MTQGQRVEIEHKGDLFKGSVSKIVSSDCCVVSWNYKKGRDEYKYNVLFKKNEVDKGRVRYEGSGIR